VEATTLTDDQIPPGEWWRTIELATEAVGTLYFIDPRTAEIVGMFLLDEGADAVAIEHWRDGRRADLSLLGGSPDPGESGPR
jgi:hypothetical protein